MSAFDDSERLAMTPIYIATKDDLQPINIDLLKRAIQEINILPAKDQWAVLDPKGVLHKGTLNQMLALLIEENLKVGNNAR